MHVYYIYYIYACIYIIYTQIALRLTIFTRKKETGKSRKACN